MIKSVLTTIMLLFGVTSLSLAQDKENFKLFYNWSSWSNIGGRLLSNYLNSQAFYYLDKRDSLINKLQTKGDWENRREMAEKTLWASMGSFPKNTPLNAKVTGIVEKDSFRIEKIVFESFPNCYVSGCLFIPNGIKDKRPAILYVCGHSQSGYRNPVYQREVLNLVKKGFIVFAYDPFDEGERLQYFDPEKGKSVIVDGPTTEHNYAGIQCLLAGTSLSKYFIYDGIRAIDYLQTRGEIDQHRIGITGRSGGGTQTAYIAAFDKRIAASAPENYITSHRRLLESRGPQDAEQNFYHWLLDGTAIEDLLIMGIPKPTLMVTTTRDIFNIQGARETYQEVSKGYIAFDKKDNFQMVEDNAEHASTRSNREAIYRFFQKHLSLLGNPLDENVKILTKEELNVTSTGQIYTSLKGENVFSLNKKESEALYQKIVNSREKNKNHLTVVKSKSAKLSGYHTPSKAVESVYRGSYQRDGYTVGMYALKGEGDYLIPLLLAVPDGGGKYRPVIYIRPDGKEEGIAPGGNIEKMVKQGYIVAAPDLLGTGETKPELRFPAEAAYGAMLIGRSIVGIQAGDIIRVVNFMRGLPNTSGDQMQAVAFGEECPALLHAAAFEQSIDNVALVEAPVSYYNVTQTMMYKYSQSFAWGVAGALKAYDLPDLAACIAPRKLTFVGLVNAKKEQASDDLIQDQMAYPKSIYMNHKPDNLKIIPLPEGGASQALSDWLEKMFEL